MKKYSERIPIPILEKNITKAASGVHFIYPKLRDRVVVKEDDKILCHKKGVYINTNRYHYTGIYNWGNSNS